VCGLTCIDMYAGNRATHTTNILLSYNIKSFHITCLGHNDAVSYTYEHLCSHYSHDLAESGGREGGRETVSDYGKPVIFVIVT
jgi:hypothetical protein